ncbi:AAA family ATPase [Cyanothece sp. BG0011]|uniref:AAA family ATPase n=1 Tax=Cyanothece sp. BG0011 TaxID=2082950 RepID=UPI0018E4E080
MAIKRGTTGKKNTQSPKTTTRSRNPQQPAQTVESSPEHQERLLDPTSKDSDDSNGQNIRPHRLEDYIGQESLKSVLKIGIKAALGRQDPLDHLLLYGPPGLGKTTMSLLLAEEMGVNCKITAAPKIRQQNQHIERAGA